MKFLVLAFVFVSSSVHAQTVDDIFPAQTADQAQWKIILNQDCPGGICLVPQRKAARSVSIFPGYSRTVTRSVSPAYNPTQFYVEPQSYSVVRTVLVQAKYETATVRPYIAREHSLRCRVRRLFRRR